MINRILFLFFFYFGTFLVCIFFIPALILPQKITLYGGKILGFWSKFCLETFLSTKIIVKGKEKIYPYYETFIDGKSLDGANIYEYASERISPDGQLICSINSSDDIKLKSFSKKIMIFPAIKPLVK